jgi:uncharacterized protein with GYD domain
MERNLFGKIPTDRPDLRHVSWQSDGSSKTSSLTIAPRMIAIAGVVVDKRRTPRLQAANARQKLHIRGNFDANIHHAGELHGSGAPGGQRKEKSREVAKQFNVERKTVWMTFGPYDFVHLYEAPNDEAMAKFAMTLASFGNVRPTVMRAWDEPQHLPLIRELSSATNAARHHLAGSGSPANHSIMVTPKA